MPWPDEDINMRITSALQAALSIHHPGELTIDELVEEKSHQAREAKKFT